ncbi:MAG: universal stress protein [Methanomassiliicoccales archaeon]|jgi:nucleotide-binding universal stress UspA family protein
MTKRIMLPTDSSLPALVATSMAVDMAKSSDSTLVVLGVIEQLPAIELERLDENRALEHFRSSDGILAHHRNVRRKSVMRGHGPEPGRGGRYTISSSDLFAGSIRSAGIGAESSGKNVKEFDENE